MIPKSVKRFSEKIMLEQIAATAKRNPPASRGLIKTCKDRDSGLGNLEVLRGLFAAILDKVVFNRLVFIEGREPGTLDRGDMDEHVPVATGRLDEPITLGRVEPFNGAFRHRSSPGLDKKRRGHVSQRATPQTGFRVSRVVASRQKRTVERPRSECNIDCNTKSSH